MTICIQCALEALVAGKVADMAQLAAFDETPEAHTARVHPDPVATQARRVWLEREVEKLASGGQL